MKSVRWFIAGALAVPLFHQIVLLLLHAAGWVARQPFVMTPTQPLGVPQFVSLAFWGGIWGVVLGLILSRAARGPAYWTIALIFGAVAPTLVAIFVAAPLKGQPSGADPKMLLVGLLVNGVWGIGTAALYLAMSKMVTNGGLTSR